MHTSVWAEVDDRGTVVAVDRSSALTRHVILGPIRRSLGSPRVVSSLEYMRSCWLMLPICLGISIPVMGCGVIEGGGADYLEDAPKDLFGAYHTSMRFRAGQVYFVNGDVFVDGSARVVVEEGVVIKFNASYVRYDQGPTPKADLVIDGHLEVQGTARNPVIFTSSLDDSARGDTNLDQRASAPDSEDWGQVYLRAGASGIVEHAELRYATTGIATLDADLIATNISVEDARTAVAVSPSDSPTVRNLVTKRVPFGAITMRGGQVSTDTVWGVGNAPFIVAGDIEIPEGVKLTVRAGTIIKFNADYELYDTSPTPGADLVVEGKLTLEGTAQEPVVFTSSFDDTVGGDTNGDGSVSTPQVLDWGEVFIDKGASGDLRFVDFRYAHRALHMRSSELIVTSLRVKDCTTAVLTSPTDSPVVVGLVADRVDFGGVTISAGQVSQDTIWGQGDAPVIILGDIEVAENAKLTIVAGTHVKLDAGYLLYDSSPHPTVDLIVRGALIANGSPDVPIVFTSSLDDSEGGDSNGDGNDSSPADGNWGTILFQTTKEVSVQHVQTYYAETPPVFP